MRYENHEDEWREEEKQRKYENRYKPYVDPRDPNYIEPETED